MTEVSAGRKHSRTLQQVCNDYRSKERTLAWPLTRLGVTGGWESENFHLWAGATGFESLGVPRFSDQLAQVWGRREKGSW